MRVAAAVGAMLLFAGVVVPAAFCAGPVSGGDAGPVTAGVVWNADRQAVNTAKEACGELGGTALEECFAEAMQAQGASPEAVEFSRFLGDGAYARRFRESGRVDVIHVAYPFRANENHGILLVNGRPRFINVDNFAALPKESMEQDRTFAAIRKSYPKVTMWPGDRSLRCPTVEALPGGGQGFVVPYTLRNMCHACDIVGTAFFSFDFDREGGLAAIRFLRVEPQKKPPKSETRKENEEISFVVMAEEGKEFTVRLNSNRTTGFQWRPARSPDERVVKVVRCEYAPFEDNLVGGGGEEIWTFLAAGRGSAEITMEYVRPWEKAHVPVKTATIRVSVRSARH
jgi:predicted secreted protein